MRSKRWFYAAWLVAISTVPAPGETNTIGPPMVGLALQQNPLRLRPVIGAPGAAVLGPAFTLPDDLTRLVISPALSFALVERATGQPLAILPISASGVAALREIPAAYAQSTRTEFSNSGSVAALYSSSRQRIQILTNLPDAPQLGPEFDLSSLPQPLTSLAVADDGATLLLGVSDGETGAVLRMSDPQTTVSLLTAGTPSSIKFLDAGTALIADSKTSQLLLLTQLFSAPSITAVAGPDDGLANPSQIEVFAGQHLAAIANAEGNAVLTLDLNTLKLTSFPAGFAVSSLAPIANRSGLLVVNADSTLFWLLAQTSGGTRLTFLPDPARLTEQP